MAARSSTNHHRSGGSFNAPKRFVPKTPTPSSSLTASMRQQPQAGPDDAPRRDDSGVASASRVRTGEIGTWVLAKSGGSFVNYLPQDEAVAAGRGADEGGLDVLESQRVVDLLNRELSRLLKLGFKEFWKEVVDDVSLHQFLDSYLQFRSRWYDFPHHGAKQVVAGIIVGELELSRRVFMVLYRMSSSKDLAAHGAGNFNKHEYKAILQEKKIFHLPKLLDICAIYGCENKELTRLLVNSVMEACPSLVENMSATVSHFLTIVNTMHQRCSSLLEVIISSKGRGDNEYKRLHADMLEVMDFINDAVATLDAFVDAYKPSAIYFCHPFEMSYGNEELLIALARLHDSLLPSLQQGFAHILTSGMGNLQTSTLSEVTLCFKLVSTRIVTLGWKLLDPCYLSQDIVGNGMSLVTATKMFPANVEDSSIRGDIIIETVRGLVGASSYFQDPKYGTFLQNLERKYAFMTQIYTLQKSGWLSMDDEQIKYLLTHIADSPSSEASKNESVVPVSSLSTSIQNLRIDEDTAILESKISQIKDIFPDYGNGFLASCLEVYNQNPEEVIQRILEGTLHEDLLSLDTSLSEFVPPKSAPSHSRADKGKGSVVEPPISSSDKDNDVLMQPTTSTKVGTSAGYMLGDGPPSSSSSSAASYGRFMRKSKVDLPESEILNSRAVVDTIKNVALASQHEYEDEYDDSFDDLGLSLVESAIEETEKLGDRIELESSSREGSWNDKTPQFYVKDGKNYSYKVSGSVAVSNAREAAMLNQAQKDLIHGLGRGGNIPYGAAKMMKDSTVNHEGPEASKSQQRGNSSYRGRDRGRGPIPRTAANPSHEVEETDGKTGSSNLRGKGRGRGSSLESHADFADQDHDREVSGRGGSSNSRGRGRGRGNSNHYRKDRAMTKHFAGLTGH